MVRLFILLVLLTAGCATRTPAPVVERRPGVPAPEIVPLPPPAVAPPVAPLPPPPPPAPDKDWRPEFYSVKRGETLYAIALEHGLDYRELAAMNNIENPNVIRVGQVLRLRPPGDPSPPAVGPVSAPLLSVPPVGDARALPPAPPGAERENSDTYKAQPKAIKLPYSEAALAQLQASAIRQESAQSPAVAATALPAPRPSSAIAGAPSAPAVPSSAPSSPAPSSPVPPSPAPPSPAPPSPAASSPVPSSPASADASDDRLEWGWPARGRIISAYSETASLKGIDIGGAAGVPIVASAAGRVVYAGSGLRGYGKLVIVKHNKTYLSAYAHLDQISIREGQNVTKGQELGKMGSTDADQVKLHFEIRALGKPVDPLRYLPRG